MSTAGRWSDIVAKIEADGGPITPHPDAETARRLAENTPRLPPVTAYNVTRLEPALDTGEELPAPIAAQPYPAEVTPEPETVETPDENESPRESAPGHRNGCQGCEHEPSVIPGCWSDEDCMAWYRGLTPRAEEPERSPVPNPPSRRGWFKIFRRIA